MLSKKKLTFSLTSFSCFNRLRARLFRALCLWQMARDDDNAGRKFDLDGDD